MYLRKINVSFKERPNRYLRHILPVYLSFRTVRKVKVVIFNYATLFEFLLIFYGFVRVAKYYFSSDMASGLATGRRLHRMPKLQVSDAGTILHTQPRPQRGEKTTKNYLFESTQLINLILQQYPTLPKRERSADWIELKTWAKTLVCNKKIK